MTQLVDAIGNPIVEGYAVMVNPGRGSVYATKVYVIGTKGNQALLLGSRWGANSLEDLVKGYKEGNPDVIKHTKVPTRIIMLNPQENT